MGTKSFWEGRKIFITGHTGFKGSWLTLLLLSKGAIVYGYSLKPDEEKCLFYNLDLENKYKNTFFHNLNDIKDKESLNNIINEVKPEIIFHLAAQALVRKSYEETLDTWEVNVLGTLNLLESLKNIDHSCAAVMVTTDKVYKNQNWLYGYREIDPLGGHDPYSASKAAMEIAIDSWRSSFCGNDPGQNPFLAIATARAGNVVGGGDWAKDRIFPDAIKALTNKKTILVRNKHATRPWQHVLDPLNGYLLLAEALYKNVLNGDGKNIDFAKPYNFGPRLDSNRTVGQLIENLLIHWPGKWKSEESKKSLYETLNLNLVSDLSKKELGWIQKWGFEKTIFRTTSWYKRFNDGEAAFDLCYEDIQDYSKHDT